MLLISSGVKVLGLPFTITEMTGFPSLLITLKGKFLMSAWTSGSSKRRPMRRLLLTLMGNRGILDVKDCLFGICGELRFGCVAYQAFVGGEGYVARRNPMSHIVWKNLMAHQHKSTSPKDARRRRGEHRGYLNPTVFEYCHTRKGCSQVNPDDYSIIFRFSI